MHALNTVTLIGPVASEPVYRRSDAGAPCAELSVASSPPAGRRGPRKVEWLRVRLPGPLAERAAPALRTGRVIAVQGTLRCVAHATESGRLERTVFIEAHDLVAVGDQPPSTARVAVPPDPAPPRDRAAERTHPAFARAGTRGLALRVRG